MSRIVRFHKGRHVFSTFDYPSKPIEDHIFRKIIVYTVGETIGQSEVTIRN